MRAVLVICGLLAALGCKREKRGGGGRGAAGVSDEGGREPRFLFRRKVAGVWRPFVESASGGDSVPVLSDLQGDLYSIAGLEQGAETMFAVIRKDKQTRGELWRLTTQPVPRTAERLGETEGSLFGASASGDAILILTDQGKDKQAVSLVRKGDVAAPLPVLTARKVFSGDVSADGSRAVVAAVEESCTAAWIGKCAIHLFEVDLKADPPVVVAAEAHPSRASYSPRFVPGSNVFYGFESTLDDPDSAACDKGLNDCRHDLIERQFGTQQRKQLRAAGLGPYYSQRGDQMVFLTMEDSGCLRLPCDQLTMYVAARGADGAPAGPRRLVTAGVYAVAPRWWSHDGRFLAYRAGGDGKTRPLRIISVADPKQLSRDVDGELPVGWLR